MRPVGIIANPASGKDIRRLVAYGSVFDNNEKVNIVRRIILGLESLNIRKVLFMPDYYGIGLRALQDLDVSVEIDFLDMVVEGVQEDSTIAARLMNEMGAACIVTLGGDGTNRAVAKTAGDTPLLPISTGTNNVFPYMTESTLAGIAAGLVAADAVPTEGFINQATCLEVKRNGTPVDLALVDVVISRAGFVGARALWDVSTLREIFLSRVDPANIGFSSIGGLLYGPISESDRGVHIVVGEGGQSVSAPIAPGLIRRIPIQSHRIFETGEEIRISRTPALIALDGERELTVKEGERVTVSLNPKGPRVIDIANALRIAAKHGLFLNPTTGGM